MPVIRGTEIIIVTLMWAGWARRTYWLPWGLILVMWW